MRIDKKIVDIARRDLIKMATMTGTAGIIAALGEKLSPTLAAVVNIQRRGAGAKGEPGGNDLNIVNTAIQIEQKAVNTYAGLEKENLIKDKAVLEIAKQFAADHLAHRDALIKAVNEEFKGTPAEIKGLGTFPIPKEALKKDVDAVHYALALEVIASKLYYDSFKDKLKSEAARNLVISILPVETQHIGVFRSMLKLKLKDKNIPDNDHLVPYAFLAEHPTPELPEGTPLEIEKLS